MFLLKLYSVVSCLSEAVHTYTFVMDEGLPTEEHIEVEAASDLEAGILARDVFTMRRGRYHVTSKIVSKHSDGNVLQNWVAGLGSVAAAAAPWVFALAPLLLGPAVLAGPSAFDEFGKWLRGLGVVS
jgi:hypothetical protein